jgi:uncharacterized protein
MKYVVLAAILVAVIWFFGRGRGKPDSPPAPPAPPEPPKKKAPEKTQILACAHCGVHLPKSEAAFDAIGRPFCTPEHRVAGPR